MSTKTSFIRSAGWKEKNPKSNQLFAPCEILPRIKSNNKTPETKRKINTNTFVCFKNPKSINEKIKKTAKQIASQIICFSKNPPELSAEKDFIVTSPAPTIGKIKKTRSQSIPLEIFLMACCIFFSLFKLSF
jgi:hypothetical protein